MVQLDGDEHHPDSDPGNGHGTFSPMLMLRLPVRSRRGLG